VKGGPSPASVPRGKTTQGRTDKHNVVIVCTSPLMTFIIRGCEGLAALVQIFFFYTVGKESIQTPLNVSLFVSLQPFAKIKKVNLISH